MGKHAQHRTLVGRRLLLAAAMISCAAAAPAQQACRLALLLALDVSSSMSQQDYALQQSGLAAALMAPDVQRAILSDQSRPIALAAYEWSGRSQQKLVLDWKMLRTPEEINQAARQLMQTSRSYTRYPTSMGYSLGYGANLFKLAPPCDRQVIDISGDGINNDGFGPQTAYRHFPFQGVTVNGLVVLGKDPGVQWFYESEVMHGAQAFLEIAANFDDFERAMTAKLHREIAEVIVGSLPEVDAPSKEPRL